MACGLCLPSKPNVASEKSGNNSLEATGLSAEFEELSPCAGTSTSNSENVSLYNLSIFVCNPDTCSPKANT